MIHYIGSLDRKGLVAGTAVTTLLALGIVVGSRNLRDYDPVLLTYTFGVLFSSFSLVYRYVVWLQRPPTQQYWRRGWGILFARGQFLKNVVFVARATVTNLAAQRFILRRAKVRWLIHFCISWGCMLALAVTFPLVFGWLHFASHPGNPEIYRVLLFGWPVSEFDTRTLMAYVVFNALNISAVMVIVGSVIALNKRLKDMANISRQQFGNDLIPLVMLIGISATGLLLTFSTHALDGAGYSVLSLIHAVTVAATFLYLPFGKFFHIVQRPAQIGVLLYKKSNARLPPAVCSACGSGFAAAMQVQDLEEVMGKLGFDWSLGDRKGNYMAVCPPCRRRFVGVSHGRLVAAARRGREQNSAHARDDAAGPRLRKA